MCPRLPDSLPTAGTQVSHQSVRHEYFKLLYLIFPEIGTPPFKWLKYNLDIGNTARVKYLVVGGSVPERNIELPASKPASMKC